MAGVYGPEPFRFNPVHTLVWDPAAGIAGEWVKAEQAGGGSGSATEYTEDAAGAANPIGPVSILIRDDTPGALTSADGDNVAQRGTDFGAAYVTLLDTSGNPVAVGGGTQYTEDAAAAANPVGTAPILVRADTPAATVSADGDNIAQRGSNFGAGYVTLLDSAGGISSLTTLTAQTFDLDTGAGTDTGVAIAIALPGAGGAVVGGTTTNPIQVGDAGGSLTVDGTVAVSGTVAVTQSGVWDEVGINDSGNSITVDNAALSVVGGGAEATALRVTIADDSTGVVSVDDNGGSLTVDGTVSVTGVSTLAEQQTQTTHLATIAGDTTDIETAVELIDDAIVADDAAFTPATTKVMMAGFEFDDTAPDSVNEGDAGAARMSARREVYVQLRDADGNERGVKVDANGAIAVTGAGGGTQYTEDAAAAADPVGTSVNLVRQDTPATLVSADGDNVAQRGTNYGAAYVQLVTSAGAYIDSVGGGTEYTEDAAAAANPVGKALIMVRADALAGVTSADGDNVGARGTDKGELYVKHVDAVPVTDNGGALTVDGTVAVTNAGLTSLDGAISGTEVQVDIVGSIPAGNNNIGDVDVASVVPGTGATNLGKAEDAAHSTGDVGVMVLGVRQDTQTDFGADGDYTPLSIDAGGGVRVTVIDTPAISVQGSLAHGAADTGDDPVKIGAFAVAHGANPTAVDAADITNLYANRHGIQFVIGGHPNSKSAVYLWTGATTDDNVMAAISTGTKYAITRITVTLDEATTVGVACRVGFGTANVPALPSANSDAVDDILFYHPGMVPGTMHSVGDGSGILGVGGDGAELRLTAEATTGGTGVVVITYFTIES